MPDAEVLIARTIADARLLLRRYDFQLFILDLTLPDGNGIDFLYDVQVAQPEAGVIIVSATALPETRDQAAAFGVLHFLEKPIEPKSFGSLVRSHRDRLGGGGEAPISPDTVFFSGSLTQLTTLDIVQLKCLSQATQRVDFVRKGIHRGSIFFSNGEIIHAETDTKKGLDALSEIVGWSGGKVEEARDIPLPPRTIHGDWQGLLLNAVQEADERRGNAGA